MSRKDILKQIYHGITSLQQDITFRRGIPGAYVPRVPEMPSEQASDEELARCLERIGLENNMLLTLALQ